MSLRSDLLGQINSLNQQMQDKVYEVAGLSERLLITRRDLEDARDQIVELKAELASARRLPTSGDMRAMELRHEATLTELHAHYRDQIERLRSQLMDSERVTAEYVGQLGAAEKENEQLVTRVRTVHALTCPDCWPDSVTIDTPLCAVHAPVQPSVPGHAVDQAATDRVRDALRDF